MGGWRRSRVLESPDGQVVELHVRVALLNRFSQIGRAQTVPVAAVA